MLSGEHLDAQLDKGKARRWYRCWYQVEAHCRLLCYNELAEFVLQTRDCAAQPGTGLGMLRLTVGRDH